MIIRLLFLCLLICGLVQSFVLLTVETRISKQNRKFRSKTTTIKQPLSLSKHQQPSPPSLSSKRQKQRSLIRGNNPLISLNLNLDSLAKKGAPVLAQQMLERIQKLHLDGYYDVSPDAVSYNSVLNAWARCQQVDAVERALQLFQDMLVEPTLVSFNTLLLVLARHGYPEQAQELLEYMKSVSSSDADNGRRHLELLPDTISYNSVLLGWAHHDNDESSISRLEAALQAESILREMTHIAYEQLNPHVKPDTISFNIVLDAWANAAKHHSDDKHDSTTDTVSTSSLILHPAKRAQELLTHMEKLHQAGNDDVEPDVYSYTSVIKAWGNSRDDEACDAAMHLLKQMESNNNVKPNPHTYAAVMNVLGKHGRAQQAYELLRRILQLYKETGDEHYKPDTAVFSSVMNAFANVENDDSNAANRALELLQTMKRLCKQPEWASVAPNAYTYTSVLKAIAKSGDRKTMADTADVLLHEIPDVSTIHYNAVLNVYAQSSSHDKAERAQQLLNHMKTEPDVTTYNTALLACANSFGWDTTKRKALNIALEIYQELLETVEPTSQTYTFVFKAIRKLVPPSEARWRVLEKAFRQCCKSGLVNRYVLEQVKLGCNNEQWNQLVGVSRVSAERSGNVGISDLPKEWSCHANKRSH